MKKIIRPGTITEMVCKKCGCLFSYESEDIETRCSHTPSFYMPVMEIKYVTCPQCEGKIILEATR